MSIMKKTHEFLSLIQSKTLNPFSCLHELYLSLFSFVNALRIYIVKIITAVTMKIPAIPFAIIGNVLKNKSTFIFFTYPIKVNISPPAITDAI